MPDIEKAHTGWVTADITLLIPKDEIKNVEIKSFMSDSHLDGSYIVRITKHTPTIEIICENETEAKRLFKFLSKSKKVVNLADMKGY